MFFLGGGAYQSMFYKEILLQSFYFKNVQFNSMCYLPFLVSFTSRENCFKVKNNNSVTFLQIKKSPITRDTATVFLNPATEKRPISKGQSECHDSQKFIKSVAAEAVYSEILCDITDKSPQNSLNVTEKHLPQLFLSHI